MPLDRTWFNTLIDDDGSNTVGSVWNKASVDSLMDAVDASLVFAPVISLALSGVQYDYNPPGAAAAMVWLLNPAAGSSITGILAPAVTGTQHLLINTTGNPLTLWNQHGASSAGSRFIGPGFADYTLTTWCSVWIAYINSSWIILKPS